MCKNIFFVVSYSRDKKKQAGQKRSGVNLKYSLLKKFIPEIDDIFRLRYTILNYIFLNPGSGRRKISNDTEISERSVRNEIQSLISISSVKSTRGGIFITKTGEDYLKVFSNINKDINKYSKLEKKLKKTLKIKKVYVLPVESEVKFNIFASNIVLDFIQDKKNVALTGGTTIRDLVDATGENISMKNLELLPARGGLGQKSKFQANTVVEELARKLDAKYDILYTPDYLQEETLNSLKKEPDIQRIIKKLENIDTVVFGIGTADNMALRRGIDETDIKLIKKYGAVAEVFGNYIDKRGIKLYGVPTIGISLEKYSKIKNVLAIARGKKKADAVIAASKINKRLVLVMDWVLAKAINKKMEEENGKSSS